MFVYIRTEKEDFWTDNQGQECYSPGVWSSGHYAPDGKFQPESDYNSPGAAAQRVHFLNGGKPDQSVLLPGEAPRNPDQLRLEENPAPDSRSPLELVVSQQTAIRALVRHYGWSHNGPNILFRPDWIGRREVSSPASTTAEPPLIELIETPGEIADLGAAAAAAIA
jgi:hypothetical protein